MSSETSVAPLSGSTAITRPSRSLTSSQPSGVAVTLIGEAMPFATSSRERAGGSSAIGASLGVAEDAAVGSGDAVSVAEGVNAGKDEPDGAADGDGVEQATTSRRTSTGETAFIGSHGGRSGRVAPHP